MALPQKKPISITPKKTGRTYRNKIALADRWATCYIIQLNKNIEEIWTYRDKTKKKEAWDNNKFLVTRFGKSHKYNHLKKFRRRVKKSHVWLLSSNIKYKDKQKQHRKKHNAIAIPGPPRKIRLFKNFFYLNPTQAGALILHELIHESGTLCHKLNKAEISSNDWDDASIKLAKLKPKKAKISPYTHQTSVKYLKCLQCDENQFEWKYIFMK